jgi:hypothetical protein
MGRGTQVLYTIFLVPKGPEKNSHTKLIHELYWQHKRSLLQINHLRKSIDPVVMSQFAGSAGDFSAHRRTGGSMRVATLVIGILLGLALFLQSLLVNGLSDIANEEGSEQSGAVGVLSALMWLVASALVIAFPMASMILFLLSSVLLFAASGDYPDLAFYGGAALLLALFSFLGWRGKKKDKQEKMEERTRQQARDDRMEELVRQSQVRPAANQLVPCPTCGYENPSRTKFCADCGSQLPAAVGDPLGVVASRAASTATSAASASMPNLGFGQEEPQKKKRFGRS